MTRQRVGKILREAAALAHRAARSAGCPPLPTTTPHTLRRTYISIALLANGFDVKWVMSQVGHADSKMTMDVYAQLEQRVDRSHGTAFDALVTARARLRDPDARIGTRFGTRWALDTARSSLPPTAIEAQQKACETQAFQRWRDPDSNRGHHDFQSCALPTELSRRGAESVAPRASGPTRATVPAMSRRIIALIGVAAAAIVAVGVVLLLRGGDDKAGGDQRRRGTRGPKRRAELRPRNAPARSSGSTPGRRRRASCSASSSRRSRAGR